MWYKSVGVVGDGKWADDDMDAAFGLLGMEFDFLITADADDHVSKLARRYCYRNKMHDRVRKGIDITSDLLEMSGVLVSFGSVSHQTVLECLDSGIPVFVFPSRFRDTLEKSWAASEEIS